MPQVAGGLRPAGAPCLALNTSTAAEKPMQVACGWRHNAGVESGRLWAWGWGGSVGSDSAVFPQHTSSGGQLGLGDEFDYWKPTAVQDLVDEEQKTLPASSWGAMSVSCGLNHTAALIKL